MRNISDRHQAVHLSWNCYLQGLVCVCVCVYTCLYIYGFLFSFQRKIRERPCEIWNSTSGRKLIRPNIYYLCLGCRKGKAKRWTIINCHLISFSVFAEILIFWGLGFFWFKFADYSCTFFFLRGVVCLFLKSLDMLFHPERDVNFSRVRVC